MNNYDGQLITKDKTGTEILGEKIKFKKMRVGKNIKLQGTLYTPAYLRE